MNEPVDLDQSVRTKHACVAEFQTTSAVIESIERDLPDLVRASPHYFSTEQELDQLVECVRIAARC